MAQLFSSRWIEPAALPPGLSHYWLFDPPAADHGSVFQATAYPESAGPTNESSDVPLPEISVDVTELRVTFSTNASERRSCGIRVNITVTNVGEQWALYSLWVAAIPARRTPLKLEYRSVVKKERRKRQTSVILLIHDGVGYVKSLGIPASELITRATLRPGTGEAVTAIEALARDIELLRKNPSWITDNFRLNTENATLTRNKQ